jgi:unsaturated chondroitin disaccharide hydrolase
MSDLLVPDLMRAVDRTLDEAQGRFPVYADPVSGEWLYADEAEWNSGFWPGILWLSAAATGEDRYAKAAEECLRPLRARIETPTVLRGFLFWYGAALGVRLGLASSLAVDAAVTAARSLSETFVPAAGVLSPGEEDATLYQWPSPGACADGLPGAVPLLALAAERTGDPALREMAIRYGRGIYDLCVRTDGSVAQAATYDSAGRLTGHSTPDGLSAESTWARAQAWAMLGLAQAAQLSDGLTGAAAEVADWYLANVPADLVCFWEFHPAEPNAPRDTSATAIAAAALVKLAPLAGDRYRAAAVDTIQALSDRHRGPHGGLIDGCYSAREGLATHHELIWGDYFALEAALALQGRVDSTVL